MPRAEYRARLRAYRDAKAAWKACRYPGSDRSLSLSAACDHLRRLVPGLSYGRDCNSLQSLQASRRREVLHLLDTLRAYRASGIHDTGRFSGPAVVQRKLRAALSPIQIGVSTVDFTRDDERMRDPAEIAAGREYNRECRENR